MKRSVFLINKIRNFIIHQNLIYYDQKILIAISGGQDSTCLALIFLQLKNQFNLQISLLYFNHLWKKSNFFQLLHCLKLSYHFYQSLHFLIPFKNVLNEAKSRNERYKGLIRVSEFYEYQNILTGHTKTDYNETVLLNLFRGSTTEGILSLSRKRKTRPYNIQYLFLTNSDLYEFSNFK